jgi:5-formyltetrahydrofolate cyclo-ligase
VVDDFPRDDIDLPLSLVVTPDEIIKVADPFPPPDGIHWDRLSDQDLDAMPVLRDLQRMKRTGAGTERQNRVLNRERLT